MKPRIHDNCVDTIWVTLGGARIWARKYGSPGVRAEETRAAWSFCDGVIAGLEQGAGTDGVPEKEERPGPPVFYPSPDVRRAK